jgi:hypothetical protein
MTTIVLLYDKLTFSDDAASVHHILRKAGITMIGHSDIREPPVESDIQIHICIPVYSAVSWSHKNILLVRSDQWSPAYDAYRHAFHTYDISALPKDIQAIPKEIYDQFHEILHVEPSTKKRGTPILQIADCPFISVITPTYHRANLIDIAFHNLLSTDYPKEKIEWIVVEDTGTKGTISTPNGEDTGTTSSEEKDKMATDKIINFQVLAPTISVKYIPLEGHLSIGTKRNIGVTHATHEIILFMDDDDHYPVTSFRRRVAWIQASDKASTKSIVCCTTLPLYDLKSGASAVSVPPFHLPLSQRISEATLTFKKSAWEARPFSEVSIAEGESWIDGRESQVIEIPPQQIIVSFSHGANQSSRIVPSGTSPSCFWGFPMEYLQFIHGLAGVSISTP